MATPNPTPYEELCRALVYLSDRDQDHAAVQNGEGFNGRDTEFGNSLADQIRAGRRLSPRQFDAALKMLRTYRKQVASGTGIDVAALAAAPAQPAGNWSRPEPARFNGVCIECREPIPQGSMSLWRRGAVGYERRHDSCPCNHVTFNAAGVCDPCRDAGRVGVTSDRRPEPSARPLPAPTAPVPLPVLPPVAASPARAVLGPGGSIASALPGYEHREAQLQLADAAWSAMTDGHHLVGEAGTGTGKSLAYLVPAILSGHQTIISTADKNLQAQIVGKDIPFLQAPGHMPKPFTAALLKGRSNYACLHQVDKLKAGDSLPCDPSIAHPAIAWVDSQLAAGAFGDIESYDGPMPPELRSELTIDSDLCLGQRCPRYSQCFVESAKAAAKAADIVIVNHALLLRDAATNMQSEGHVRILPPATNLVIDECFPGGTLVDGRPIESIKVNDYVTAMSRDTGEFQLKRVLRTFRNSVKSYLVAFHAAGRHVVCTPNHKILTSNGWMQADILAPGDMVLSKDTILKVTGGDDVGMQRVRATLSSDLYAELPRETRAERPLFSGVPAFGMVGFNGTHQSRPCFGADEDQQPDASRSIAIQNEGVSARPDSRSPMRQRARSHAPRDFVGGGAWLGDGCDRANSRKTQPRRSESLQAGRSQSRTYGGYRDRRTLTQILDSPSPGCQENHGTHWARVDRVEILQPGSDGEFGGLCPGGVVYNLEVEGFHTYTANGIVVSNCHHLEEVTTDQLGVEITLSSWRRSLARVENLAVKHRQIASPLLGDTADLIAARQESAERWQLKLDHVTELFEDGFAQIEARLRAAKTSAQRLGDESETVQPIATALAELAADMLAGTPNWLDDPERETWKKLQKYLDKNARTLAALAIAEQDDSTIRYAEIERLSSGGQRLKLVAKPIDVAELLRAMIWDRFESVTAVSATLAVGESFGFWRARTGLDEYESTVELIVPSPFDYRRNALLYIPSDTKAFDPSYPYGGSAEYTDALAAEIERLLQASDGRAFVLFTSYRQLRLVHEQLAPRLKWTTLVQGTMPPRQLIAQFKADGRAILFGTRSFWEGVDIQGEALSMVIVDKLPFSPPDDPVWEAKCAAVNKREGNDWAWFRALAIPQATVALKQGFGRLIRTRSDRGVVAILDARLAIKPYGQGILNSLPPARRTRSLANVQGFFA